MIEDAKITGEWDPTKPPLAVAFGRNDAGQLTGVFTMNGVTPLEASIWCLGAAIELVKPLIDPDSVAGRIVLHWMVASCDALKLQHDLMNPTEAGETPAG